VVRRGTVGDLETGILESKIGINFDAQAIARDVAFDLRQRHQTLQSIVQLLRWASAGDVPFATKCTRAPRVPVALA